MEIDRFTADILWGRTYNTRMPVNFEKRGYGASGRDAFLDEVVEFQPLPFYNSYADTNISVPYGAFSLTTVGIYSELEIHEATEELWIHGNGLMSKNIVFPQDIAHPYMAHTGNTYWRPVNANIVVGRPSMVKYHADFKRKGITYGLNNYVPSKFIC